MVRKHMIPFFVVLLMFLPLRGGASEFVNLTPYPKTLKMGQGTLRLPQRFVVGGDALGDSIVGEINKFVADFNRAATGVEAVASPNGTGATLVLRLNADLKKTLGTEGYGLTITRDGITLESATRKGFYYGLVSIKKMLPACIMAGVKDAKVTTYTLPCLTITDSPRFKYRGFMLDVSRHFFSVAEVKRILDVMAAYKMNVFHFHLTDDQGWRWEVKQYPELTRVGSVAANTYITAMYHGAYWTNAQYGPYFYTQDELCDIVAYAADRHIEIVPEIDMPGHFVAAMASYPEYSCNPDAAPAVWTHGGVSSNVLNVANPQAVQFAKNILTELMDIFPSTTIHIGGDECPTSAWEHNAQCQAQYKKLGLNSYRQLQSHFIKAMDEHVRARGRKLAVWNEAITAAGSDLKIMEKTGATVYCWTGAANAAAKATQLKMPHVYTPQFGYYINRQPGQAPWEQSLPGNGSDDLKSVYNHVPFSNHYTLGIQGTFWTEHVGTDDVLEYLAFPRLMAVAEAGWTPQSLRNFDRFVERMRADTTMLNYNGYQYGRNYLRTTNVPEPPADNTPPAVMPEEGKTYIVRCAVEAFKGTALADNGNSAYPQHTADRRANIGWVVNLVHPYDATKRNLTLRLKNATTHRSIGAPASEALDRLGYPLSFGAAAELMLTYNPKHKDFTIAASGKNLFPVPHTSPALSGMISAGNKEGLGNAVRPQGAAWQLIPARIVTFVCQDTEGKSLGTLKEFTEKGTPLSAAPTFPGYVLKTPLPTEVSSTEDVTLALTYERAAYLIYRSCEDTHGGLLLRDTLSVPVGETLMVKAPKFDYYTPKDVPVEGVAVTPTADRHLKMTYETEAYSGVKAVAEPVGQLEDGHSFVIYDAAVNDPKRAGFRNVNPTTQQVMQGRLAQGEATPYFTWTLEKSGARWKVKNELLDKYLPEMVQSGRILLSNNAGLFNFTLNADKETWKVQGSNRQYWDGAEGFMTGWHTYGHPYRLHRYFVKPYFSVTVSAVSAGEGTILSQQVAIVPAGSAYTLVAPVVEGRELVSVEGPVEQLKSVSGHLTIRYVYGAPSAVEAVPLASAQHHAVYDLSGRRTTPSRPGLYIVNGAKVLVK